MFTSSTQPIRPSEKPPVSTGTAPGRDTRKEAAFSELLVRNTSVPRPQPVSAHIEQFLTQFSAHWSRAYYSSRKIIMALSPESRPLLEAQMLVGKLGVETQLLSQIGEACSNTIRKIQQFGSS